MTFVEAEAEVEAGRAWRLLELLCVAEPGSAEEAEAVALGQDRIDADFLVVAATRHMLGAALADFLTHHNLLELLDANVMANLVEIWRMTAYRTQAYVREAARIVAALQGRQIRVAAAKGVVGQALHYDGRGTRWLNDIDLLVGPEDADGADRVLRRLGYSSGVRFDLRQGALVPLERRQLDLYRLYPDRLPPSHRLTGDAALPVLTVDTAFSLTWFNSSWQLPMADALSTVDSVEIAIGPDRLSLPALTTPFGFLLVLLNVFRDAWFLRTLYAGKTVRLSQFADIVRYWRRSARAQAAEIGILIRRYGLAPAATWVLHHVDAIFGTTMVAELGLTGFADECWLASVRGPDGSWLGWHGDMRRRLRGGPALELTPIPAPPFVHDATSRARPPLTGLPRRAAIDAGTLRPACADAGVPADPDPPSVEYRAAQTAVGRA